MTTDIRRDTDYERASLRDLGRWLEDAVIAFAFGDREGGTEVIRIAMELIRRDRQPDICPHCAGHGDTGPLHRTCQYCDGWGGPPPEGWR